MRKGLTIDNLGSEVSVEWAKYQEHFDAKYVTEVPLVSKKTEQAIVDIIAPSQLELLFDVRKNSPWALFLPFKGYLYHLKKLFQRKLIPYLDPQTSSDILDEFFEKGEMGNEEDAEKIYQLLEEIVNLDKISEDIVLGVLTCVKS